MLTLSMSITPSNRGGTFSTCPAETRAAIHFPYPTQPGTFETFPHNGSVQIYSFLLAFSPRLGHNAKRRGAAAFPSCREFSFEA